VNQSRLASDENQDRNVGRHDEAAKAQATAQATGNNNDGSSRELCSRRTMITQGSDGYWEVYWNDVYFTHFLHREDAEACLKQLQKRGK
jgi:hypothetical protein